MYFNDPFLGQLIEEADVLVFDVNGLVIDDEPLQQRASILAFEEIGLNVHLSAERWIQTCVGRKAAEWIPDLFPDEKPADKLVKHLVQRRQEIYASLIGTEASSIVREGVIDLFCFVADETNKKLAIASSTGQIGLDVILGSRNLGVCSLFDFVVSGDRVKKAKPDPEIYLLVKKTFGSRKNYLVFEDAGPGVISGAQAGMNCLAVPNAYTKFHDFTKAAAIADSLLRTARRIISMPQGRLAL